MRGNDERGHEMTEGMLTREYLSRFPTNLQIALCDPKHRQKFLNTVSENYEPMRVYRGTHQENTVTEDDFISIVEEAAVFGVQRRQKNDTIEIHGISVNTDPMQLIKAMHIPNKRRKIVGVAGGMMDAEYGPADFKAGTSHHNWYIYEDSRSVVSKKFVSMDVESFQKEGELE